jgi:transcription termination factor Rho
MNLDIMKERYESLPVVELRAVAKARGMRGISALRKEDLIIRMLEEDKKEANQEEQEKTETAAARNGTDQRQEEKKADKKKIKKAAKEETAEAETETKAETETTAEAKTEMKTEAEGAEKENAPEKAAREKQKRNGRTRRGTRQKDTAENRRNENPRTARGEETAVRGERHNGLKEESETRRERKNSTRAVEEPHGERRNSARAEEESRSERRSTARASEEQHSERRTFSRTEEEPRNERRYGQSEDETDLDFKKDIRALDSGNEAAGILEVMADGYGFIRSDNFLPGEDDVYVSPSQIRKFGLKTGDIVCGNTRNKSQTEKFSALLFVKSINGMPPSMNTHRRNFEDMTPIFPNERIHLERPGGSTAMRIVDLVSPIGKGQRGMIVSPPKAGKTTLLKDAAKSILQNNPEMHIIILLIDERPEEVTDMKETVKGPNVEVIYSTFDELPEHHKRVSEMVIERAKRLVELGQDVIIFIDSITRLARAYNQVVPPSGRTLSGGLDPAALHMPKRFFGAARNIREGGSLTILATALVETGSKMDDVVYEEFKGTGNMELILDRKLQERRVFPAIDLARSGTRREDLLLSPDEIAAVTQMRRALNGMKADEAGETIINLFAHTRTNAELVQMIRRQRIF